MASTDSDNQLSHRAKILVAEDNPVNQMLISKILNKANYQFEMVNNGLLATQAIEKNKFDLILMDIQMPVMDGLTATRIIKENNPELPIIAVTANTDEDEIISYRNMDFYGVIPKPFKMEDLESMIFRALG
ncbi:MAG: response regulator [Gammaproteobacteria bacterium]|nr:response regulator [Gammaproteobacteria bacterium]